MKLKNPNDGNAIYDYSGYGPTFGKNHDLNVNLNDSAVNLRLGYA